MVATETGASEIDIFAYSTCNFYMEKVHCVRWKHRALRQRHQLGSLGSLEGMKVDNIKPEKIVSSSPLVTVHKTMSKELDEKVAKLHFLALRAELTIRGFLEISSRVELECWTTPA